MIYDASFRVQVTSPQKAAALRDAIATFIDEDPDVDLITWSAARHSRRFVVVGVNVETDEPFQQVVDADDEDHARSKFSTPQVVAAVQERPV